MVRWSSWSWSQPGKQRERTQHQGSGGGTKGYRPWVACKHCPRSWVYADAGKGQCQTCGKDFPTAWPPLATTKATAAVGWPAAPANLALCLEQAGLSADDIDESILKTLADLQAKKAAAADVRKPQQVLHESTARVGAAHAAEQRARLAFEKVQKNIYRLVKEMGEYQDKLEPARQQLEEAEVALEAAKAEQAGLLVPATAVKNEDTAEPSLERMRQQMLDLQAAIEAASQREREREAAKEIEAAAAATATAKAEADKEKAEAPAASSTEERPAATKLDGEGLRVSAEMETDEVEGDETDPAFTKVSRQVKRLNDTATKAITAATNAAKTAQRAAATPPRGRQKTG